MPEQAQKDVNGNPAEGTESAVDVNGNDGSRVGRGVKAALLAAAAGTAVAAATKARRSSDDAQTGGSEETVQGGGRAARARGAVKRSEPAVAAAWEAGRGTLEPMMRDRARQAGRFVAEHSPDFVRESVIPPFVEGLTEGSSD